VQLHSFLTQTSDDVKDQHLSPAALTPEYNPGIHRIGSRMGPTAGLNVLEKRNVPCLYRDSNPASSGLWPSHYTSNTLRTHMLGTTVQNVVPWRTGDNDLCTLF
jgi:hypothetical protein